LAIAPASHRPAPPLPEYLETESGLTLETEGGQPLEVEP
jgi:hypothetical protein